MLQNHLVEVVKGVLAVGRIFASLLCIITDHIPKFLLARKLLTVAGGILSTLPFSKTQNDMRLIFQ